MGSSREKEPFNPGTKREIRSRHRPQSPTQPIHLQDPPALKGSSFLRMLVMVPLARTCKRGSWNGQVRAMPCWRLDLRARALGWFGSCPVFSPNKESYLQVDTHWSVSLAKGDQP